MKLLNSLSIVFALVLSACATTQSVTAPLPQPSETDSPSPAWLGMELTEASSGKSFTINDFKGKVVVVDSMAIWCPNCFRQAMHLKDLRALYGSDDLVIVTLDIDSHEDAAMLSGYAKEYGFDWFFAVAPMPVMHEVGNTYGALFLDPTLSPTLVVDRKGEVFKMGFGEKKTEAMRSSLAPMIEASK